MRHVLQAQRTDIPITLDITMHKHVATIKYRGMVVKTELNGFKDRLKLVLQFDREDARPDHAWMRRSSSARLAATFG